MIAASRELNKTAPAPSSGRFVESAKLTKRVFDIAIIGGGIIGLTLARALQKEKADVAVIDAGAHFPAATNAAAGMLAPSFEDSIASEERLYAFGARSLGMWQEFSAALQDEVGFSIDYRADGILGVAFEEAEARRLAVEAEALNARGGAVELLSGDEARQMESALSEKVAIALHAKHDAQVDPRKTLLALRAALAGNIGLYLSHRVECAVRNHSAFSIKLAGGENIEAAHLVIASGAAAGALIDGLPPPPVHPVKGEAAAFTMPEGAFRRVVRAPGAYLCPKSDGRLVLGATERDGCSDYEVDSAAIAAMVARGAAAVPAIAGYSETERWAGIRPGTPDGAPILGHDRRGPEGVFLALGHYRNGILLAPATAAALAAEILGHGPAAEIAAFRPERFAAS